MDLDAVVDTSAASRSGVACADELLAFADAQVGRDDGALAAARSRLRAALGDDAFVDAAAVVANFERMVRIADATGTPLDAPVALLARSIRARLGLARFASAANTPEAGPLGRALGRLVAPVAGLALRLRSGGARPRG